MRIQPRQQLLEIWAATVRSSWDERAKVWRWGGRDGSNSISDAEQLLCLLMPATQVTAFNLDRPDETAEEMIRALRPLGNATEIPRTLIGVLREYFTKYSGEDGTPIFSGGTYFASGGVGKPSKDQLDLDIVDSFAMSVTLSLAVLGFLRVLRAAVRREESKAEIDALEDQASVRLSAAMVGLLRSFTVNVFDVDTQFGQALIRTVNQANLPQRQVVSQLRRELRQTIASLPRDPDRLRPGERPRQPRPALRVRLVVGHRHGGAADRDRRAGRRAAEGRRAGRAVPLLHGHRPRRASRTSSPSAPGSSACSTTSSSGCPGRCSCGGS